MFRLSQKSLQQIKPVLRVNRLELYENQWLELSRRHEYKVGNCRLLLYGFLEYSPLSVDHVSTLLREFKVNRIALPYSLQKMKQFYSRYNLEQNEYLKKESIVGFRYLVSNMLQKIKLEMEDKQKITAETLLDFLLMKSTGIPCFADLIVWLQRGNDFDSVIPLRYKQEKVSGIASWFDKLGQLQDKLLFYNYTKSLDRKRLYYDPNVRTLFPRDRIQSFVKTNEEEMKRYITWAEKQLMVFTPDETEGILNQMKLWQRHSYYGKIHRSTLNTIKVLEHELKSMKNIESETCIVCVPRLEMIDLKNSPFFKNIKL